MDVYRLVLFIHVLAAAAWFGGHVLHLALVLHMSRQSDAGVIRPIAERLHALAEPVFGLSAFATLGAGIWLVYDGPHRISDPWVGGGLGLLVVAMALGGALDGPAGARCLDACDNVGGEAAQAAAARWLRVAALMTAVLATAFAVMVMRPGM